MTDKGYFGVVIGTKHYSVSEFPADYIRIIIFDSNDDSLSISTPSFSTDDYVIADDQNLLGMSYDGTDIIYFILKKVADSEYYLVSYSISNDTFTVNAIFNVSLMLDRNTDSTNDPPFNLEKGFDLSLRKVYQISNSGAGLNYISDLTSVLADGTLVGITDTYLIVLRDDTSIEAFADQDVSSHIAMASFTGEKQDIDMGKMMWDSRVFTLTKGMFVQFIGTKTDAEDGTLTNSVIFEGVTSTPDLKTLRSTILTSQADEIDRIKPKGLYSGRTDEIITSLVADNCKYCSIGTLSSGTAMGNVRFQGDKSLRRILNEFAEIDHFTWYFKSQGELYYDDGTNDTTVDITTDNADNTIPQNIDAFYQNVGINAIIVKGAFVNGVQIISAKQSDADDVSLNGETLATVTDGNILTVALANTKATALLAKEGGDMKTARFNWRDTSVGVPQKGQSITLKVVTNDISLAEAQYIVDFISYDEKSKLMSIECSTSLVFILGTNDQRLPQENSQLIEQVNDRTNVKTGWKSGMSYSDCTVSFDDGTRTFTLTPVATDLVYYIDGVKYDIESAQTVVIDDTEGLWYIYFDGDTLTASQTPWEIADGDKALISVVYWDAANNLALPPAWEFHSYETSPADHDKAHHTLGCQYDSGFVLTESSEQLALTGGILWDEDIKISITDGTGSGLFEQELGLASPFDPGQFPILYQSGATGTWRWYTAGDDPIYDSGGNTHYNSYSAPNWASTAASTSAKYINYWMVGFNGISEPVFMIMGQAEHNTQALAEAQTPADLDLTGLPYQEIAFLYQVVYKSDGTYMNAIDWRKTNTPGGVYTPTPAIGVSDEAYSSVWNGVTTIAPSKNAAYDIISTLQTAIKTAIVQNVQSSGTGGGAGTVHASNYYTITMNAETDPSGIVSLLSNQFTLAAGTYIMIGQQQFFRMSAAKLRIQNVTDGSTVAINTVGYSNTGAAYATAETVVFGITTIAASKAFELQYNVQANSAGTQCLGVPRSIAGENEFYGSVLIIQIA